MVASGAGCGSGCRGGDELSFAGMAAERARARKRGKEATRGLTEWQRNAGDRLGAADVAGDREDRRRQG